MSAALVDLPAVARARAALVALVAAHPQLATIEAQARAERWLEGEPVERLDPDHADSVLLSLRISRPLAAALDVALERWRTENPGFAASRATIARAALLRAFALVPPAAPSSPPAPVELARASGLERTALSKFLATGSGLGPERREQLAAALGCAAGVQSIPCENEGVQSPVQLHTPIAQGVAQPVAQGLHTPPALPASPPSLSSPPAPPSDSPSDPTNPLTHPASSAGEPTAKRLGCSEGTLRHWRDGRQPYLGEQRLTALESILDELEKPAT